MSGINRIPQGLIDFLLTQAGGRNPDNLLESVRPVLDIEPYYYPDRYRAEIKAFNLTELQFEAIVIPDGEVWRLLSATIDVVMDVGEQAKMSLWIERMQPLGLNGVAIAGTKLINTMATAARSNVAPFDLPAQYVLTGGQRIAVRCDWETGGGGLVGDLHVSYVKIQ